METVFKDIVNANNSEWKMALVGQDREVKKQQEPDSKKQMIQRLKIRHLSRESKEDGANSAVKRHKLRQEAAKKFNMTKDPVYNNKT